MFEQAARYPHTRLLLLGHTNSASTTTGGLGVLTTDTEAPHVAETTVLPE